MESARQVGEGNARRTRDHAADDYASLHFGQSKLAVSTGHKSRTDLHEIFVTSGPLIGWVATSFSADAA